jgi:Kdo2-lipid IVA lauroyltransferase/acyltransferase
MKTFKENRESLFFAISTFLLIIVGMISKIIGDKARAILSKVLARIYYCFAKSRRLVAIDNISRALPKLMDTSVKRIALESFENFSITFLELLAFKKNQEQFIKSRIKFENPEELIQLYAQKKGMLFLSAHYGNWEYLASAGKLWLDIDILILVKLLKNRYADKIINTKRTYYGVKIVDMKTSAREMIKTIKSNKALALLADQSAQENLDVYIQFFGRPTLTYEAPAELALKFNIPLVECFPERQPDGTYIIRQNVIDHSDLEYSKENVKILTQRHADVLEQQIRKIPGQWSWMHKRWKHTPAGQ